MTLLRSLLVVLCLAPAATPASLPVSTYLKDGFNPTAIASDPQGNLYIAGTAVLDPIARTLTAIVMKLDPTGTRSLYVVYLDRAANSQIGGIAVDRSGNAYIAGATSNPDFPVVGGGSLGTPPTSDPDTRPFVVKLNPQGVTEFSVLLGGSTMSSARGIALTPEGRIVVSGFANTTGFPVTEGAYTATDPKNPWFLTELDATASKVMFSATGIGGTSIAFDPQGNIYVAGSGGTDYPTTPGAFQTTFVQGYVCFAPCQIEFPGGLQHVSKIDPTGSKLIYSTGLNDPRGGAGSTVNTGLAVDRAGNAYVTGTLVQAAYPFTVSAPPPRKFSGYVTKLDPAGAKVIFSLPVGGGGVQLDDSGAVYVGGVVTSSGSSSFTVPTDRVPPPAIFSWVPSVCWPNNIVAVNEAYVMKLDGETGAVLDGQWIDGSLPGAAGLTIASGKAWLTGSTAGPDIPFTVDAIAPSQLGPGFLLGAYVSAVDFSTGPATKPSIGCVLDAGNLSHTLSVSANQLLSIFGANLGPEKGVAPTDPSAQSLAGVSITFDGVPAELLYVSATQVNVAVPPRAPNSESVSSTLMKLSVNGVTVERRLPYTPASPNLFADVSAYLSNCPFVSQSGFQPLATNADGSLNACSSPAKYGSTVSLYVHGLGSPFFAKLSEMQAFVGSCLAPVTKTSPINSYVYKVDVLLPDGPVPCAIVYGPEPEGSFPVTLKYGGVTVGPRLVPANATLSAAPRESALPMIVWVTR